jgi:hypothetical protein
MTIPFPSFPGPVTGPPILSGGLLLIYCNFS